MGEVRIPAGLAIDRNSANQGTTALGFRRGLLALIGQTTAGQPMVGRFGDNQFVVSGSSTGMEYKVSPGGVALRRVGQGVYLVGMETEVVVPTDAANGTNPRIDRIYVHQPDPVQDGPSVDVQAVIGVAVGVPSASPALPAIPGGALEIGRKTIAAGATSTATGAAIVSQGDVIFLNGRVRPHEHTTTEIKTSTGVVLQTYLADLAATVSGKASASHNHSASQITSGTLPITRGGTGGTTAAAARSALGAAAASHDHLASGLYINSAKTETVLQRFASINTSLSGKASTSHTHLTTQVKTAAGTVLQDWLVAMASRMNDVEAEIKGIKTRLNRAGL